MISEDVKKLGGVDSIHLTADKKNINGNGYQRSHVWGFQYSLDELPTDKQLESDLETVINVFKKLKTKINKNAPVDSISRILNENKKDKTEIDINKFTLINEPVPKGIHRKAKATSFKGKKVDYQKENEEKSYRGRLAEEVVLNEEIKKLSSYNEMNGTNLEPVWKSKIDGDGLGYDILSFDNDGNEIYIEVKSTSGNKNEPFFLTSNELQRLTLDNDRYFIYRVYNLDLELLSAQYYILHDNISNKINLEPSVYICSLKL